MIAKTRQYLANNLLYGGNSRERNRSAHYEGIPFEQRVMLANLSMPDATRVWGIDASHWNLPPLNLVRMRDVYGMSFAIFKGCDGSLNTKYYPEHAAAAKQAGLPWGMYVWLYPNAKVSIDAQVNAWHARFTADPPPMGCFIDAEWTTYAGLPANPNATDLRTAHDKWRSKSRQAAATYTAKGYADTYLKGFDWSREELWVANYGVSAPNLPAGASVYTLWQFSSTLDGKQLDPNGNAELDGNYYNGSHAQFAERYGQTEEPVSYRYEMISSYTMSFRPDHKVESGKIPPFTVAPGVKMYGDLVAPGDGIDSLPGDMWLHVRLIAAQPVDGWVAVIHKGQVLCTLTDHGAPPPPSGGDPAKIHIQAAPGTIVTVYDDDGTVLWSGEAK